MTCKRTLATCLPAFLVVLLTLVSLSCKESLPTYIAPSNVMSLAVTIAQQLPDRIAFPGRQEVHVQIVAQNIYDTPFEDSVNVKGTLRIWWERFPDRQKTFTITSKDLDNQNLIQDGKMTMVPGQKFAMDFYWNCYSDAGQYLPGYMNYEYLESRICAFNVACSDPEYFMVEATLNVFDRLGYVTAKPYEMLFVGRVCVTCGYPPCPSPPGGCDP